MTCAYFQLDDFFAAGIGFDLGGAYLLAKGLIMAPRKLTQVSGSYWGGNDYLAVSVAQDRLDAIGGVGALFLGFGLQLVGYLVLLARAPVERHGVRESLVAAALAALTLAASLLAGRVHQRVRLRPTLLEMAHYLGDEGATRLEHPRGELLVGWGRRGLEVPQEAAETDLAYLGRVFGVEDAVVSVQGGGFRPLTSADGRSE